MTNVYPKTARTSFLKCIGWVPVVIIFFSLLANVEKANALSVIVTQASTATVNQGATGQAILRVDVSNGTGNPHNTVTQMKFTMQNTANADVTAAKLYYTGTSTTFATTTQVGSTVTNPTGTVTFTFSQAVNGTGTDGYFWLAFDISSSATPCNTVDATVPISGVTITGDNAGTYNSTADNPTGNRQVTATATASIVASPSGAICSGTSVTFTATPTNGGASPSYQWQVNGINAGTNSSTFTTSSLTNGQLVKVILTSSYSCLATATSNVITETVNPLPVLTATPSSQSICSGAATSIALSSSIASSTFAWNAPSVSGGITGGASGSGSSIAQTLTNPSNSASGSATYAVTVTAPTGCTSTSNVVITVNPKPSLTVTPSSQTICSGAATALALSSSITGSNTYSLTTSVSGSINGQSNVTNTSATTVAQTLTNLSNTVAGTVTYSITTTSAAGCASTATNVGVDVNPNPAASVGSSGSICTGNTTTIGASAVGGNTYSWVSNPSGFTSTTSSNTVSPTVTTTYSLTETITATGCSASNNVTITVNPLPAANAGSNATICSGTSTTIGAAGTAGHTYSWTSNPNGFASSSANPTVSPTITTTYSLTETITATGCSASNNVVVTVNPIPNVTATPTSQTICSGTATNIALSSNVAGATFAWTAAASGSITGQSNGSGSTIAQTLNNGAFASGTVTYTITPTASGCTGSTTSAVVTVNPPFVTATTTVSPSSSVCDGTTVTFTVTPGNAGTPTYQWQLNGTDISGATNSTYSSTALQSGDQVSANVTSNSTCTAGITSGSNAVQMTVYPIPSQPVVGSNSPVCVASTLNLTASSSGATYAWTGPNSFSSTAQNPNITNVTAAAAGTYSVTSSANGCTSPAATIDVIINPQPAASAGSNVSICNGNSTTIGATAVIGDTYSWVSNPSGFISTTSNPTVTPTVTTTYSLTETITATGCTKTNSVVVTVNPLPAANAGSNTAICTGTSTTIGAASIVGHTYSWTSNPAGFTSTSANPSVSPTITTTYSLTETITATGCSASNNVTITVNPLPAANAGSNGSVCSGSAIAIGAAAVAGDTYSWTSNPAGFTSTLSNPSVSPTVATTYSLTETITATGCTKTNSVTITVNPLPAANAGTSSSICSGGSKVLGALAVGGNTYSWVSNPSGFTSTASNPTVTPTITTTYSLTETVTATGCTKTNNVVVTVNPLPAANAGSNTAVCTGTSTSIGASAVAGDTYAWTSSPSGFTSTSANPTVTPTITTTYSLTETVTGTGCSNSHSVTTTVNPLPTANAGSNTSICTGNSTTIGAAAVGGDTYSWVSNPSGFTSTASNPSVSPTVTTTYSLTETITSTGCTKTNSVTITVNPLPTANAGSNTAICSGTSTTIGAASITGNTYSWASNPAGFTSTLANPTVSPTLTTTYSLTETITATGCNKTNSVVITVNPLPAANAGSPSTVCAGSPTTIGAASIGGHTYSWTSNPTGFTSTAANPTVSPTTTTTYSLTETITATGCNKTNSVVITVNPLPAANVGSPSSICNTGTATTTIGTTAVVGDTYSWVSNPSGFASSASSATVAPTVTTTYSLTETITATGCTKTNSVVVTVNPLPTPNAGNNATICYGASTVLGSAAVAGHSYTWTPSAGLSATNVAQPTATLTVNTTYTLTETITATGCSATDNVAISLLPQITATPTSTSPICIGSSTQLAANAYRKTSFTNSNSYSIPDNDPTGVSSPITVSGVGPNTILSNTVVSVNFDISHYKINLLKIYLVAPNGTQVEIVDGQLPSSFMAGQTDFNNTTISASSVNQIHSSSYPYNGTYASYQALSGLAGGPLNGTWNLKVVQPSNPTGTIHTLNNWTLVINTNNGITYNWSSNPSGFSSTIEQPTASPTVTTTYTVVATDGINGGCTASGSTVVVVNPLPAAPTVAGTSACSGQSATLTATAPSNSTFTWYTAATGGTLLYTGASYTTPALTSATSYYAQTTSAAGCASTSRTQATVTVNPVPTATVASAQTICPNTSAAIGAASTAGHTYSWVSNPSGFTSTASNPTVTPTATTTYSLTETITTTGCTASNSVVISVNTFTQWTGTASTDWNNSTNWCGGVPTSSTNVVIQSGAPNYPVIVSGVNALAKNLTITPGGSLTINAGSLTLYGHLQPASSGLFTQTGGQLTFLGNATQNVNDVTVKNVEVNNTTGINLLGNMTVTGTLLFTNGNVITNTNEVSVTNTAVSAISNYSLNGYVVGNLRRSMDTTGTYDFPVGTATKYELATLTLHNLQGVSNAVASFSSTITGSAPNVVVSGTVINTLLNGGIWTITPNQQPTSGKYDVTLHERGMTNPAQSNLYYTDLKRANSTSAWTFQGQTIGTTQSYTGGTITVPNYNLTSFSDFAIGYGNSVLPITLTDFTAKGVDHRSVLDWHTASEYNNDRFDVQRSFDGTVFQTIGSIAGHGTTNEPQAYHFVDANAVNGINYYRLKQIDFDSTFHYSNVEVVEFNWTQNANISIYPNPAQKELNVLGLSAGAIATVYDLSGRTVLQATATTNQLTLDVSDLAAGNYMIRVFGNDGSKGWWSDKFTVTR